jgi:hypothetical protein
MRKMDLRNGGVKLTAWLGRKGNTLPVSSVIEPSVINTYFQGINTDPEYTAPHAVAVDPWGHQNPLAFIGHGA